jgi:hypothetical protein
MRPEGVVNLRSPNCMTVLGEQLDSADFGEIGEAALSKASPPANDR